MSYDAIHSFDESDKNKKTKPDQRSSKERKNFQHEFQELNELFNDALELPDEIQPFEKSKAITNESTKTTVSPSKSKNNEPLTMEQSYNSQITKLKEKLNRLNIIQSDKTGRLRKAAGEDL